MAKKLSLLKRLDLAKSCVSSESQRGLVYAKFYELARQSLHFSEEEFYENILPKNNLFSKYGEGRGVSSEKTKKARELSERLRSEIAWPDETSSRGYGRKIRVARHEEYEILRDYFRGEKNAEKVCN